MRSPEARFNEAHRVAKSSANLSRRGFAHGSIEDRSVDHAGVDGWTLPSLAAHRRFQRSARVPFNI